MLITLEARRALLAAADWLQANPDKHITGVMARHGSLTVPPTNPNADCFCALGRVAMEAGVEQPAPNWWLDTHKRTLMQEPIAALTVWFRKNVSKKHAADLMSQIMRLNDMDAHSETNDREGRTRAIGQLRLLAGGFA